MCIYWEITSVIGRWEEISKWQPSKEFYTFTPRFQSVSDSSKIVKTRGLWIVRWGGVGWGSVCSDFRARTLRLTIFSELGPSAQVRGCRCDRHNGYIHFMSQLASKRQIHECWPIFTIIFCLNPSTNIFQTISNPTNISFLTLYVTF